MIDASIYRAYMPQVVTARERLEQEAARRMQEAQLQQRNRLMELQIAEAQAGMADRQQARQRENQLAALAPKFYNPGNVPGDGVGPSMPSGFDFEGYTNALAQVDPLTALKVRRELQPEQIRPQNVAPGGALVDPATGRVIFQAPFKPEAQKEDEFTMQLRAAGIDPASPQGRDMYRKLIERKLTPPTPTVVTYGSPVPIDLGNGATGYAQPSNRGGPVAPMAGADGKPLVRPADNKAKDLTEAQSKATTFLGQMRAASSELKKLGMDQSALSVQAETALAGGPANIVISRKAQQVRQAQDQWSEAYLRFKTGAAATQQEVDLNRRTFFPVIGDKADVIEQKRRMRLQAERDMETSAGRGVQQLTVPSTGGGTSDDPLGLRGGR